MQHVFESCKFTDESTTFLPFYDSVLPDSQKSLLGEVKVAESICEKVRAIALRSVKESEELTAHEKEQVGVMLIKYRPRKSHPSKLLNDLQISNLLSKMPSLYRNYNWQLLYRLSEHGVSMNTFLKNVDRYSDTLLVFEDESGHKFGAYCSEAWHVTSSFFGSGENFVFTFGGTDQIEFFKATGDSERFQYCQTNCIGIGGGTGEDRFAVYVGDDFYRGSSS